MADGPDYPPRPERMPLMAQAELFADGRRLGEAKIRNLSAEGLGGSGFNLRVGQPVSIRLNGIGLVPARVIWTDDTGFGLTLEQEIDVHDFDITGDLEGSANFASGRHAQGGYRAA